MESFEPGLNQKQFGDFIRPHILKFEIVSLAPNVPCALHLRVSFLLCYSSEVSGPINAVFRSTDLCVCVLHGDHDNTGR